MKKTLVFLMFLIVLTTVLAVEECANEITSGVVCAVTAGQTGCTKYDIYHQNGSLAVDNGTMSLVGTSYNFTFSQTAIGRYTIILCNNQGVGTINVVSISDSTRLEYVEDNVTSYSLYKADVSALATAVQLTQNASDIRSDIATAQTDLDTPNQYKADVSSLATTTQLLQNTSAVISRGNTAWITATGFLTSTQLEQNTSAIISRGDSAWITAVGFSTHSAANVDNLISDEDILVGISSNTTHLKSYGDTNWATATGFASLVNASKIMGYVDVLPATAPVSWDDTNDVDTVYTYLTNTLYADMEANFSTVLTNLATVDSNVDSILVDTGTTLPSQIEQNTSAIMDEVDDLEENVTTILTDTNELQTDWTNGGRLDLLLDAVLVNQSTIYAWLITDANIVQDSELAQNTSIIRTDLSSIMGGISANTTVIRTDLSSLMGGLSSNTTVIRSDLTSIMGGISANATDIKENVSVEASQIDSALASNFTQIYLRFTGVDNNLTQIDNYLLSLMDGVSSNTTIILGNLTLIRSDLSSIMTGISSNSTWVNSSIAATVWNYNISSYDTSADLDSAGAYLKAVEEYSYG